jgi:8-oxo-dGTP pyrophosphatase MutT (NUDIX family)
MPDASDAAPVPASTVALLRNVAGGVEVCMLRRPDWSSFAAGAFVFPGGSLDPGDGTGDTAYPIAGVREVLEEVGVLIGGPAPRSGKNNLEQRITAARGQLLAGVAFDDVLAGQGLEITPERLVYIAHFITPPGDGRRYDTRFFAYQVRSRWEVSVHPAEAVEGGWHRPESMLSLDFPAIMPPTRMLCHEFARLGSVEMILETLGRDPIEVTEITPAIAAGWMSRQHDPGAQP